MYLELKYIPQNHIWNGVVNYRIFIVSKEISNWGKLEFFYRKRHVSYSYVLFYRK